MQVTASIGLVLAPAGRRRPSSALLATADLSLYQAKEAGRNRVVCSQGLAPQPLAELGTLRRRTVRSSAAPLARRPGTDGRRNLIACGPSDWLVLCDP